MFKRIGLPITVVVLGAAGCSGGGPEKTATATTQPAPVAAASAAASSCHPNDPHQDLPRTAPRQVWWQRFKGVAVPFSPAVGPMQVKGDTARCYAHSPRGALIAAVQISVRLDRSTEWRGILEQQVVAGEGKTAYARARASQPLVADGDAAQIAGFRIVSYTPDTAVVGTVSRDPARGTRTTHTARTTTVKWDGDWKLAPTTHGSTGSTPQVVKSLSAYVFWGGF
ncbi:hypothetical protein J4573_49885 [Actinomadura barringtoniae]|uniref:DUF8175 domain-containing protein n=1 Tax=Actinomadura barringtoniae TaxID=1427535 RepID=A0A939T6S1_9ACTN|nr:hypothetical protein [Actinomadura barringtoniae]MBO2455271.1 hypothetical protein [Actinomadura barringtoniae]